MEHHIFLSYSSQDTADMERIKQAFHQSGLSVWTMQGITPGTLSWQRSIEKAIKEAGCLVVILSPDASASDWVRKELEYAELQQIPRFIVLVRGNEKDVMPFGYASFQFTDVRNNFAKIQPLISEIHKHLEVPTTSVPETSLSPTDTSDTVRLLVEEVIRRLTYPYGEDVIEDVFVAIEANSYWRKRYDTLVEKLKKNVVNQLVGRYTRDITKLEVSTQVPAKRSKLTGSYSKLKPRSS